MLCYRLLLARYNLVISCCVNTALLPTWIKLSLFNALSAALKTNLTKTYYANLMTVLLV